ncbi:flavodoxin-like protein [Methanobrevibacter arboriphilus JCM 13429 = DSM 1125]|uniref:Flavodoxin-like protein n=2 Tax=Methanobrevibacter arboriphilus TaxID=39441 RepID=A0A1V6N353_METAZ|nr:flavodoxin-like protein [Methanobrevibacter arboriphilus JCM 13429 = DSM 1125]
MEDADYIIIGSPIYFGEVTAQTKLFTDRFYSIYNNKNRNVDGKKVILIYTQGNPDAKVYEEYTKNQKAFLYDFMNFDVVNTLIAAGIHSKEDLNQKNEILKEAENIAMRIT